LRRRSRRTSAKETEEERSENGTTSSIDNGNSSIRGCCTDDDVAGVVGPLSVTLLSTEHLPRYSTERFYMLSELEVHADSLLFLSSLDPDNEDNDASTQETEELSNDESQQQQLSPSSSSEQHRQISSDNFPSYCILYLLWRPGMTSDPKTFVETTVLQAVTRLEGLVRIVPGKGITAAAVAGRKADFDLKNVSTSLSSAESDEDNCGSGKELQSPVASPGASITTEGESIEVEMVTRGRSSATAASDSQAGAATGLYIVVDRVEPPRMTTADSSREEGGDSDGHKEEKEEEEDSSWFLHQEQLAQQLARHVAMHPKLRPVCHGVTVGLSNHERAAPGLEACVNAVSYGSTNRRNFGDGTGKSLIGILAPNRDCMLGLQEQAVTDAAQGVLQSRITAEWNGLGNLQSFAKRAHANWRRRRGLPPQPEPIQWRKIPRRIPRSPVAAAPASSGGNIKKVQLPSAGMSREVEEFLYDLLAAFVIALYLGFHYRYIFHLSAEDLVQELREWGH